MLDLVRRGRGRLQIRHQNRGVEVLAKLRDALILERPYVHPVRFFARRRRGRLPFHENPVANASNARALERKGVTRSNTSEQAHHVLLAPGAIEPPLQILVH